MNLNVEKTTLENVFKISYEYFPDNRGEINNIHSFHPQQLPYKEDKLTVSKKNVLRGFHGDSLNDKLIFCLKGSIKLLIINYDKNHKQFLKSELFYLNENIKNCIFVPKNYLNAHYCLEDTYFFYRWSYGYVNPEQQISIRWDSLNLKQKWQINENNLLLSERDKTSLLI